MPQTAPKTKPKLLLPILIGALILALGLGALYFFVLRDDPAPVTPVLPAQSSKAPAQAAEAAPNSFSQAESEPMPPQAEPQPAEMEESAAANPVEESSDVMSHAQYAAAAEGSIVVIETYVQATESWWDGKVTVFAQSPDGAYYIYNMACSEADAAKLVPGTKIRVTGWKSSWSGLVEIVDGSFTFMSGSSWIAEPADFAALLAGKELESHMSERIDVTGATVLDKGNGKACFYGWDNYGTDGECDLYFDLNINGTVCTFVVRRYLTAPGSEVYEAVKNLKVGDTVDIQGFLYWYEGPQPFITSIAVK
jgi:hypothetical protein